ncbi:MAG: ribosome silencing factor [Acutalibacteraceae bacterium]|nr:ribosome silencing factor [Clostridia bacterium]MEE3450271.1 ribosome silencing factor [Acutalibacteraceae bacterium]
MTSIEIAKEAVKAIDSKRGTNIKLIKVGDVSIIADYFVIATGQSSTQVKALADEVEYQLKEKGENVSHIEGYRSDTWILLDYIDVIVHVFSDEAREYYDLDRMWADGVEVDISDIIVKE